MLHFSVRGFGTRLGSFCRSSGVVLRALGTILGASWGLWGGLGQDALLIKQNALLVKQDVSSLYFG